MRLEPDFSHNYFARKDISWRMRKPNAKQNRFQIVTIFFYFFSSAYFLTPRKNHNLGFLSNTGPDLLKNHKATKPAFNVGPLSAPSEMAFRWRADDGAPIVVF